MTVRHMITKPQFMQLCKLRAEGLDVRSISDRMGRPYSSVRAWLRSETMSLLVTRFFEEQKKQPNDAA